jgi:hypothetical protein
MANHQALSTTEQLNKIITFRQAVYEQAFTRARDAQFELLDALLLSSNLSSFPELRLSPVFHRQWHSVYAALARGRQDQGCAIRIKDERRTNGTETSIR